MSNGIIMITRYGAALWFCVAVTVFGATDPAGNVPDSYGEAMAWYGDEAKSPTRGTSVSAPVTGTIDGAYRPAVGNSNFTGVAVEYGTIPSPEVLQALRADNWLHLHGDLGSDLGKQIKREIRDAFFGEDEKWQQDVYDRGLDVTRKALAGLAG